VSSPEATREAADSLAVGYERLREDALERRRVRSARAGASVLHRQGMAAWIRLYRAKRPAERSRRKPVTQASAPARSELLTTLTDLVFQTWARRSSS
jgi:hypothetical protein